jgi:hypothetical protein
MAFEVRKVGKLADQLESMAYEWVLEDINVFFGVTSEEEMTRENVAEIEEYLKAPFTNYAEGYCRSVLTTIVNNWLEVNEIPYG